MLLVNERRLTLDDPVAKHLTDAPAAWKPIAVRHLLTHTSGLPRESPAFDPMQNRSDRELLSALHAVPLRFVPGEKWEYSNSGYIALAEIIRVASGQPWADFLHQRVFAPAGMNATMPTNTQAVIANRASGYTSNDNQCKAPEWVALRASGAFLSSVVDLAKWEALLYTDKILDGAARKQMWTRARLNDGTTAAYGLGWHVDSVRGQLRVWHGGGLPGFTAHFVRYVDDGLTVIVLTNGDDSDVGSIANGVARLSLPVPTLAGTH